MCKALFLKESDTSLWRSQTNTKIKPKQTELAKQKHDVNTMHTENSSTENSI